MTHMLWVYLLHTFSFSLFFSTATEPRDRWLVQVAQGRQACLEEWISASDHAGKGFTLRSMPVEGWFAVQVPAAASSALQYLPCVLRIEEDRPLEWRDTEPNDPAYGNQGDMHLIDMPEAWDLTTGGLTSAGDTIVVAVIDDGYDINHQDLVANIYYNHAETPDDAIDNDDNGYKDDFRGYNVSTSNDNHPIRTHGTSVAGITGARGNNGVGVAGINWNVKLLLMSGANFESELIESYQYIHDVRKAYNDTDGTSGAFIVAANLSAGVEGEFAADHPVWCEMYDRLGSVGVLSVCAAPNRSHSVDVMGDMPTTCGSQYMIAVTNVDLTDELVGNAGYGNVSIDIGAPGHGTITTASNNLYREFTGTSSATPHVTGSIALIYSTPCEFFLDQVDEDPAFIARKVRDLIFASGQPNNSLDEITVTGKRLRTGAALMATNENCAPNLDDRLEITKLGPSPVHHENVIVEFQVVGDTSAVYFELYAVNGMKIRHFPISADEYVSGTIQVPTASLPPGVYLLSLRSGREKVTRKIFVY